MLRLGNDVLGLARCSPPWPPRPLAPLGLARGGEPWRPVLHRSFVRGRGTAVCRGLAGVPLPFPPLCRFPLAGSDAVVGVLPCAGPQPAAGGWGGGGVLPCPPVAGGENQEGSEGDAPRFPLCPALSTAFCNNLVALSSFRT